MTNSLGASALICIPTFNERDNVEPLAAEIFKVAPKNWHILFVDDGSPDGTGSLCDALAAKNSRVHVLHRKGKLGLATAYIQGFQWGLSSPENFDWFFEMDADFSHQPLHLKDFAEAIESKKWDVICGSRYVPGGGVSNWDEGRQLLSRMGTLYSQFWLRYSIQDWTGGFNAWSRATLDSLKLETIRSKGYAFQIEMKYRALVLGLRIYETPIVFQERRAGASKMSGSIVKEALLGVARLKWDFERGRLF